MAIFWPLGQFFISLISWIIIPSPTYSCKITSECNWKQNIGWRLIMIIVSGFTLSIVISRSFIFKLYETPRYLVMKGRYDEACKILHDLADKNGKTIDISSNQFSDIPETHISSAIIGLTKMKEQLFLLFSDEFRITMILLSLIYMYF
jgi:MFS family permease